MSSYAARCAKRGPGPFAPAVERALFPYPDSWTEKVQCSVCGARGYAGGGWQHPHRKGHAPCPDCGRQLTLRMNGAPRVHTRCPSRQS